MMYCKWTTDKVVDKQSKNNLFQSSSDEQMTDNIKVVGNDGVKKRWAMQTNLQKNSGRNVEDLQMKQQMNYIWYIHTYTKWMNDW